MIYIAFNVVIHFTQKSDEQVEQETERQGSF
jgi:hypothetical protein